MTVGGTVRSRRGAHRGCGDHAGCSLLTLLISLALCMYIIGKPPAQCFTIDNDSNLASALTNYTGSTDIIASRSILNLCLNTQRNTAKLLTVHGTKRPTLSILLCILLSGDVQTNPGPVKYPCGTCQKPVATNHRALQCDHCEYWIHIKCADISPKEYALLCEKQEFAWICSACYLPNFTDSFFEESSFIADNSFNALNGGQSSSDDESDQSADDQQGQTPASNRRVKNTKCPSLKVVVMNCNSLRSIRKQALFQDLVHEEKPDIILGTESHLDKVISDAEAFPSTYRIYRKDRNKSGGGVFIAVDNNLTSFECTDLPSSSESVWVKVACKGQPWLFLGSHYRPPDREIDPITDLSSVLSNIAQNHPSATVMLGGDFNLPSISWDDLVVKEDAQYGQTVNNLFIDMLNDLGLSQMVNIPTRLQNTLDLIITNKPDVVADVSTLSGISDHQAVTANISISVQRNKKPPRKVWQFDKGNIQGLIDDLKQFQISFLQSNYHQRSVEENWKLFKDAIHQALEKNIPSKVIKGGNDLPWVRNRNIRRLRRKRKRSYNRAKKTKKDSDWQRYQVLRNQVKKVIERAHEDYVTGILNMENQQKAPRKFWSYIRARGSDDVGVAPLMTNDGLITTGEGRAGALIKQYDSVLTDEDLNNMPDKGESMIEGMPTIMFRTAGIQKLLANLDASKASGPDQVPVKVLKLAAAPIAPILQVLMTQSYRTGDLPEDWKTANIVAIFKKGDKSSPANYRPVSLTSVICKMMEHIIFRAIMDHSDSFNILTTKQHGFRPKFSCETQLISTIEDIARSVDRSHQVDMLVLDFSKAFDKVPHRRLLHKLAYYGIRGHTLSWIEAWLCHRSQKVVVEGSESPSSHVKSGVPQGTVLGPLMFLLFINDIVEGVTSGIRLFADDCVIYRETDNDEERKCLQEDLDRLVDWSHQWQMEFNPSKCVSMSIISPKRQRRLHEYTMMGHKLKQVEHATYLGVEIAQNMSWDKHINQITNKANQRLGFVKRNMYACQPAVKEAAYRTLVRPHLEYASAAWDPYLKNHITKIEAIQRRAARFIANDYQWTTSVTALMAQLEWQSLEHRRAVRRLLVLHNILNNNSPIIVPSYIIRQQRQLRSASSCYIQPQSRTEIYRSSFFPRTIADWKGLPIHITALPTPNAFRMGVERHYGTY